jgi:hypothetical protein
MRAFHAVAKYYDIVMINNNDKKKNNSRTLVDMLLLLVTYSSMGRICMRIDHGHGRSAVMLYSYYCYIALQLGEYFNGTYY